MILFLIISLLWFFIGPYICSEKYVEELLDEEPDNFEDNVKLICEVYLISGPIMLLISLIGLIVSLFDNSLDKR